MEIAREEGRLTSLTTATKGNVRASEGEVLTGQVPYYEKLGFERVAEEPLRLNETNVPFWAFTKK